MNASDHRINLVIKKIQEITGDITIDKGLALVPIEEMVVQRKLEESKIGSASGGIKDLQDKISRLTHSLDELKKSYFKNIKDLDGQISIKASNEQLIGLESNLTNFSLMINREIA